MNELNPKLLADLARLASKYRPKDWEQLAAWLEDEKQRKQLRLLILELAAASRPSRKRRSKPSKGTKRPSAASQVREKLANMRIDDPTRADLLEDTWLKLRERELLPTIADVRAFAQAIDSKGIQASRRDQAVTELLEMLIGLPSDSFEHNMRQAVVEDRNLGEEYQRWVKLILSSRDPVASSAEGQHGADAPPTVSS
jgi:hypothetical protein